MLFSCFLCHASQLQTQVCAVGYGLCWATLSTLLTAKLTTAANRSIVREGDLRL